MIPSRFSNLFIQIDRVIDTWIPLVSPLTNAGQLLRKGAQSILQTPPEKQDLSNRLARHLNRKSMQRCAILMIPILGHLAVNLYDFVRDNREKRNAKGHTKLISRAIEGDSNTVDYLIKSNANLEARDKKGYTALIWAADKGHTEIVDKLLTANADTENSDNAGVSPLMWAAQKGNIEIMQALIKAGADLDAQDHEGKTALMWAAEKGNINAVKLLRDKGADVNASNHKGQTVLMCSASKGKRDVVEELLQANPALEQRDKDGHTAFAHASNKYVLRFGQKEMLELLIAKGADVNPLDDDGCTPLISAMATNDESSVELLKELGAKEGYATEFITRKFLANLWGAKGISAYTDKPDGHKKQKLKFNLEGFYTPYAVKEMSRHVSEFFSAGTSGYAQQYLTLDSQEAIKEAVEQTFRARLSPPSAETIQSIRQRITANKPVMMLGGSVDHCISMVIVNNQLVVCNRGEGKNINAVKYYDLPADKITDDLIKKLLTEYPTTRAFKKMISGLKLKLSHKFIQKDQTTGNCVLASLKSAIGVLCIAYASEDHMGKTKQSRQIGRLIYKDFTKCARTSSLKKYTQHSKQMDLVLLRRIKKKSKKKKLKASISLLKDHGIATPSVFDYMPLRSTLAGRVRR